MTFFAVTTVNLLAGAGYLDTSGVGQDLAGVGAAGAAAQTPVAGAWAGFVDRADQTLRDMDTVTRDLSRALRMAADAYAIADQAAVASMQ